MQKNKNRTGLALGSVFAMVASLFVISSPAQAIDEGSVVISVASGTSGTSVLHGSDFTFDVRRGDNAANVSTHGWGLEITKPADVLVRVSNSGGVEAQSVQNDTVNVLQSVNIDTTSNTVAISLPSGTSVSASVTLTVTPFLDRNNDGDKDNDESSGDPITITFHPWSDLGATLALATPIVGETNATASFAVTPNSAINWGQLGAFEFTVTTSGLVTSVSDAIVAADLADTTVGAAATAINGSTTGVTGSARAYSASLGVEAVAFVAGDTLSASIMYGGEVLVTSATATVGALSVGGTTVSPVTGDNIVLTADTTADARVNSAFSLNVFPFSASVTTSVAVASVLTVSDSGTVYSVDTGVSVNGTLYTSSAALVAAEIAVPAGTTTVAVATVGQTGTPVLTFTLTSQLQTSTLTVTAKGTEQVVIATPAVTAGTAGAAKTFTVTAQDQWSVSSVRTDQRIAASVVLGGSTSTTVSAALVNGAASIAVTPTPATRTGSAVVTFTLQTFNQATQLWETNSGGTPRDTVTWNVYTYTAGTDAFTSRTVSVSGTISYGVALSWSDTVTVGVLNSYSDVVISAPGLMIQNVDDTTQTASDTLTVAANGQAVNAKFTSRLAGTYTVTFTTGAATTTSEVVIAAAAHDSGATLTFDKTSIAAGTTTTITGTLKDINGNPVMTSGSSNVSVAWTGKGLPFGNTTTMETNADGELSFYVLVLSGEEGDAAISATYKPAGLTVDTDNITVVQAVAVGKAAAADQKVTIGTYKGYVAVFTKGYAGQKLSVQLASKWHVRNPIVDLKAGYSLLTVNTGAGYVANVIVYIDGVEVKRETITTK